ncbi:12731_t:CDS:2, partial [Gigaspora rosea]
VGFTSWNQVLILLELGFWFSLASWHKLPVSVVFLRTPWPVLGEYYCCACCFCFLAIQLMFFFSCGFCDIFAYSLAGFGWVLLLGIRLSSTWN